MRLYGKCGKSDPCHDHRHCVPEKGSRTKEKKQALIKEGKAEGQDPPRRRPR